MARKTLISSTYRVAIFAAALVLVGTFASGASAFAVSPHVVPTSDTDSCGACHVSHTGAPALIRAANVLRDDNSVVCIECHSVDGTDGANVVTGSRDSFGLTSGHSMTATSTGSVQLAGCSVCHETHAASSESPMIPARKINGVDVAVSGPQACEACHDADDSWFGPGYPSTSAPSHDATGFPVSGTWTGPATYASATDSHRLIPATTQTTPSGSVTRQAGDCLYCHAAHRGPNTYDGLVATFTVPVQSTLASDQAQGTFATLCFDCHGGKTPSGFATAPVDIKQFTTTPATVTANPNGHAIVTPGGLLPVGSPVPCFECHNPHGSKRDNKAMISDERGGSLETSTAAGVRRFCFTCHATQDTAAGWDSDTHAYVPVRPDDLVVGLPRNGGVLLLPPGAGHNEADADSCYDCHGDSYAQGGSNVHDPQVDGQFALQWRPVSQLASDTVPPVTTANLAAAYSGMVTLDATDTGSGVAETMYSLDAGVLSTGTVVTAVGEGTHTVQFWSVDNASNVETPTVVEFVVDTAPPLTASDATATYVDTATITLLPQDGPVGTGVEQTYYRLDAGDVATGTVVSTTAVGTHTLDFWSVDMAGNAETTQSVTFSLTSSQAMSDRPPPALGASPIVLAPMPPGWIAPDALRAEPVV